MENERMLLNLERSAVPFTYRFLGLRLRLAFTKRRFDRVETRYLEHMTNTALATRRLIGVPQEMLPREVQINLEDNRELLEILESSFTSLRLEIDRIEKSQRKMRERALPLVEEQLALHDTFMHFLSGFRTTKAQMIVDDLGACNLPMLNQGNETTTAIKKLIAEFAGVPIGMYFHDLRSLENLLHHQRHEDCHLDDLSKLSETEHSSSDESSNYEEEASLEHDGGIIRVVEADEMGSFSNE